MLGVYGLSLLVAFVNAGVAYALLSTGRTRMMAIASIVLVLGAVGGRGTLRVRDGALLREGEPVRVGLVQANISQDDKWKASEARRIFTTYLAMTRDVVKRGAQFVMWPESSTPFMFEDDARRGRGARTGARDPCAVALRQRSDRARSGHEDCTTPPSWSRRTDRRPGSTGRCTWCRSASTSR